MLDFSRALGAIRAHHISLLTAGLAVTIVVGGFAGSAHLLPVAPYVGVSPAGFAR